MLTDCDSEWAMVSQGASRAIPLKKIKTTQKNRSAHAQAQHKFSHKQVLIQK